MIPNSKKQLSVAFLLSPQFTMSAFSGFIDVLRLAADEGDRSRPIQCSWAVVSPDMRPIKASCGIEITPTAGLEKLDGYDYVIIVGGLLYGREISPKIITFLKQASERDIPLIGLCTGSFILARAGLMNGFRSCVSWFHHNEFVNEFPDLFASADELFIVDRDRLTSAGGTSVVHLAAHIVERHWGKAEAEKALRIMIEDKPLPSKTPQPQPLLTEVTDNLRVRKALLLIERNIATPLSLEEIAQHVHISGRQLERWFSSEMGMSPTAFAMTLRLRKAYDLLVNSHRSIIDISLECGFVSCPHFSKNFRKAYGQTPSQTREKGKSRRAVDVPLQIGH